MHRESHAIVPCCPQPIDTQDSRIKTFVVYCQRCEAFRKVIKASFQGILIKLMKLSFVREIRAPTESINIFYSF